MFSMNFLQLELAIPAFFNIIAEKTPEKKRA
jgi:hypothetical protein